MATLTYRQLQQLLSSFTEEELDMNVSVYHVDMDEFYPVDTTIGRADSFQDSLDEGHPFLALSIGE